MGVSRSKAPPRALHLAHALHVLARVDRAAAAPRSPRGASRALPAEPVAAARARPRSRGSGRRARGGRAGVVLERGRVARKNGGMRAGTVPARRGRAHSAPTSPSSAPAPPASTPRSWRPAEGARVALVSRSPLAADGQLLGPGRDRRRARGGRLARAARRRHARRRPRRRPRRAPCGCSARSRPTRVRDLQRLGVQLRRRPRRQPRARARGRALAAPRSCTRAARPPAGGSRATLSALAATRRADRGARAARRQRAR